MHSIFGLVIGVALLLIGARCQPEDPNDCRVLTGTNGQRYGSCSRKRIRLTVDEMNNITAQAEPVIQALANSGYNEFRQAGLGKSYAALPPVEPAQSLWVQPGYVSWCREICYSYFPVSLHDGTEWWDVFQWPDSTISQPVTRCICPDQYCNGTYAYSSSINWKGRCVNELRPVTLLVHNKWICTMREFMIPGGCCCAPYKFKEAILFVSERGAK